jgi:hypothetical protein
VAVSVAVAVAVALARRSVVEGWAEGWVEGWVGMGLGRALGWVGTALARMSQEGRHHSSTTTPPTPTPPQIPTPPTPPTLPFTAPVCSTSTTARLCMSTIRWRLGVGMGTIKVRVKGKVKGMGMDRGLGLAIVPFLDLVGVQGLVGVVRVTVRARDKASVKGKVKGKGKGMGSIRDRDRGHEMTARSVWSCSAALHCTPAHTSLFVPPPIVAYARLLSCPLTPLPALNVVLYTALLPRCQHATSTHHL